MEIYNFTQDDLMTEDIFILDCHSDIFVWVGQLVDTKSKLQALTIGEVRTAGCIGGLVKLLKNVNLHVPHGWSWSVRYRFKSFGLTCDRFC